MKDKIQLHANIYKTAVKALQKSELKDIILKSNNLEKKIKFALVQSPLDMRRVWQLRKKVFVQEENYPPNSIKNPLDRGAVHFLAKKDNIAVGSISVYLDAVTGLPIEKLLNADLGKHKKDNMAEIEKLAVVPKYRKTAIPLGLMVIAYEFVKLCDTKRICIFTLSEKKENIKLYKKFGFKKILEFNIFDKKKATCMILDVAKDSIYEKMFLMNMRRSNFAQQLAKMLYVKLMPIPADANKDQIKENASI